MNRVRRVVLLGACSALLAGCAYYNGLYNANRLANEAKKAARQGRSGEARSFWSQAAVKAESVVARYPNSKYRDDALLLQGTAYVQINSCSRAVPPLEVAADSSPDESIRIQAGILLGRCKLVMREPVAAWNILTPVVASASGILRDEALLWRGRAALARGAYQLALQDLRQTARTEAAFGRALALARLGRSGEAAAVLDSLSRLPFDESEWRPVLDSLGATNQLAASSIVQLLTRRPDVTRGSKARLLLDDGVRWNRLVQPSEAEERFEAVMELVPDSVEGRVAAAHLLVASVRQERDLARVPDLAEKLREVMADGGLPLRIAGPVVRALDTVMGAIQEEGISDLELFLVAEWLRDSISAYPLSARVFRKVQDDHPSSAIAPKALIAAAALDPAFADSLYDFLQETYPESPYTMLAVGGAGGERFAAVEDSLRKVLRTTFLERRIRERRELQRRRREGDERVGRRRPSGDRSRRPRR